MDGTNSKAFYRSLSFTEYKVHEVNQTVNRNTEWTARDLIEGFPLEVLKVWVDHGSSGHGLHDLVIQVLSSDAKEFRLKEYADYFNRDTEYDRTPMIPHRYINVQPINFARVEVVYDPRSTISRSPNLKLVDILKHPF